VLHHRKAALATVIISRYPMFEDHCPVSLSAGSQYARFSVRFARGRCAPKRGRRVEELIATFGAPDPPDELRYGVEYGASAASTG
jgi:hypothetical protein